jgi:hypothetical protein
MGAATLLINIVRICGSLFRKRILLWSDFSFRTLLGLIIGFTCSMATGRYEQRKNYEEAEANAIGTRIRPGRSFACRKPQRVRAFLANYTGQRVLFYQTRDEQQIRRVNADTAQLQTELWPRASRFPTNTCDRIGCFGHERCTEFAGVHPGCLVEPHPGFGMGPDVNDRSRRANIPCCPVRVAQSVCPGVATGLSSR